MKFLNKKIFISFLFFFFIFTNVNFCFALLGDIIHIRSDKFRDFIFVKSFKQYGLEIFVFKRGEEILQIEKRVDVEPAEADVFINDDITAIQGIFMDSVSAYPGELSNKIVCDDQYKPRHKVFTVSTFVYEYLLLYSTSRFGLGACTKDSIYYKHLIGWLYCFKRKELYTIKYFCSLKEDFQNMESLFKSFICD